MFAFDASVMHNVGADCLRNGVGGKGLSVLRLPVLRY